MDFEIMEGAEVVLLSCLNNLHNNNYCKQVIIRKLETLLQNLRRSQSDFSTVLSLIENAIDTLRSYVSRCKGGNPMVPIPYESLDFLLNSGLKVKKIAEMYQVNSRTIFRRMEAFGLSVRKYYSVVSQEELDETLRGILLDHPNTGYKRVRGFLRSKGVKVPVRTLIEGMRRVDPEGVAIRKRQNRAIYRRQYFVKYSMEIWHIDTHHKLIRYGFVIRGGIDGKSRTIVFLNAGCDNTSRSNLLSFMEGVRKYGIPLRTRSDKGGENVGVAEFMLRTRGVSRGSHICGRSVHNQRIERLWRDVHSGCLTSYKQVFINLENDGYLDMDDPRHVAVLQYVFLPRINKSLQEFADSWNYHPMSSEHGQTPQQMFLQHLPPPHLDASLPEDLIQELLSVDGSDDVTEHIVHVEPFEEFLSDRDREILRQFDVTRPSNNFGADIFVEVFHALFR